MLARSASMANRIAMYNGNALKIGLFGANCSSGRTLVAERTAAICSSGTPALFQNPLAIPGRC